MISSPEPIPSTAITQSEQPTHTSSPDSDSNQPVQVAVMSVTHQMFEGPLPSPRLMEAYEKVLPSSAQQIIDMAVKEQGHRHQQDQMEQSHRHQQDQVKLFADVALQFFGLLVAATLAIGGIYCAWDLFSKGNVWGVGILITSLAGIIIGLVQAIRVLRMNREDLSQITLPAPKPEPSDDSPTKNSRVHKT
jgi:uncharacterized membrane protein